MSELHVYSTARVTPHGENFSVIAHSPEDAAEVYNAADTGDSEPSTAIEWTAEPDDATQWVGEEGEEQEVTNAHLIATLGRGIAGRAEV